MAGWHQWLNGRESEWTPGVGDGQGGLACCDSWGCKESDTTERLNWTEPSLVAQTLKTLPGIREWQPTPVLLPGESHGGRSLVSYSPWGYKESDTTERLHFSLLCTLETFTTVFKAINWSITSKSFLLPSPPQNIDFLIVVRAINVRSTLSASF